ncbi:MAG TPA: hypothetical protein VHY55_06430 [Acidimicrobiia bacterium]|jgi:hypothetical protein|nr:hypothetical protein [Acidimicrobiia bacterium]
MDPRNDSDALRAIAGAADRDGALQGIVDEFGRAAGASAALLSVGGWGGVPIGGTWLYDGGPWEGDVSVLDELVEHLRDGPESALEPGGDILWRSRTDNGSTCDFISVRVRRGGLPRIALCAALDEPADPPEPLVHIVRHFGALASLCVLDDGLDVEPPPAALAVLPQALSPLEARSAIDAEISRCGLSGEPISLCFVSVSQGSHPAADWPRVEERVVAVLAQVLAEAGQPYDVVGRLGVSELVVAMPGADHNSGVATARHLMRVTRLALGAISTDRIGTAFRTAEWNGRDQVDELLSRSRTEVSPRLTPKVGVAAPGPLPAG